MNLEEGLDVQIDLSSERFPLLENKCEIEDLHENLKNTRRIQVPNSIY